MKICILSKSDPSGGGSSKVAKILVDQLNKKLPSSCQHFAASDQPGFLDFRGKGMQKIEYYLRKFLSRNIGLPDFLTSEAKFILNYAQPNSIFHVHDISTRISPITLKKISKKHPVIWTFHDTSPFTGGCINPLNCTNYINTKCNSCPQLDQHPMNTHFDWTGFIQNYKIDLINNDIDLIITPSKWLKDLAISAGVAAEKIKVIENPVNTNLFIPKQYKTGEKLRIVVSSSFLNNPLKGIDIAINIINSLNFSAEILLVGKGSSELKNKISSTHMVLYFEQSFNEAEYASHIRSGDILLYTSIADNAPLTILESLSSGIPTIAFKVGGIGEIIEHNVNGWLATLKDEAELTHILNHLNINRQILTDWKINARSKAEKEYGIERFILRHLAIYQAILEKPSYLPTQSK